MRLIKKIFLSLLCVGTLVSPFSALMASTLVLQTTDDVVHKAHSSSLNVPPVIDQRLANRLYDISQSLLFRLEDDFSLNAEFLECLKNNDPLGEFSDWMTSATRTVSREEKIQKTKNILGNIQRNHEAVQQYEDWIIGYSQGSHSAEQLFEALMNVYLAKSKDRVEGLLKGQAIPPILEKHMGCLDQYSQGLAQQNIDTHTLLYLLLETLYDSIEIRNISPQSQTVLKHMPVLRSLLEGRNAAGPNPDLSLLDGAIFLSGDYVSPRSMPDKITFRGLRDNFKKSFAILKSITERQIIVKGRSETALYRMGDFLPTYEDVPVIVPPLVEKKHSPNANKNKNKRKKRQRSQKAKPQASVVETIQGLTTPSKDQKAIIVIDKQEEEIISFPSTTASSSDIEETLSTPIDISDKFESDSDGDEESTDPQVNIQTTVPPVKIKAVVDLRPTLHQKRWSLLSSFWEENALSYKDFTTLFEGFGGEIKQTKGGSSHVKLFFTTPEGLRLINGTWRPHPKPILRGNSLKHLRNYFEDCGFIPDNYQLAR